MRFTAEERAIRILNDELPGTLGGRVLTGGRMAQQASQGRDAPATGGGGLRYATRVVGTATAGYGSGDVDYLCDGVDDQVEINQAIADCLATPNGFGKVLLLDGVFSCSAKVDAIGSVTLEGMGGWSRATQIRVDDPATFADAYLVSGAGLAELRGVYLTNPDADGTEIHLLGEGSGVEALIENVVFDNNDAGGIYLPVQVARLVITNCGFFNLGFAATRSAVIIGDGTLDSTNVVISGNVFYALSGPYSVELQHVQSNGAAVIAANTADTAGGLLLTRGRKVAVSANQWGAMVFDTCRDCPVVGNHVRTASAAGHGITLTSSQDMGVSANVIDATGTDAIHIASDTNSNVQGNTMRGSWTKGWTVDAGSSGTRVTNNDGVGLGFTDAGTGTVTTATNRT